MKKVKSRPDELRPEYKRSDFTRLERGRNYERVKAKSNIVVLNPKVAAVFHNSDSVNRALESLLELAEHLTSGSS